MKSRGFTLIELAITVAIVAVLASVALPLNTLTVQRAKEQDLRRDLRQMREAIDAYRQAFDEGHIEKHVGDSGYPKRLEDLVAGVEDQKDPRKSRIYFLRRIPRDPMETDPDVGPAESWAKRSYESPPDEPKEGEDVFDVYSRAEGVGLNGRPYREW